MSLTTPQYVRCIIHATMERYRPYMALHMNNDRTGVNASAHVNTSVLQRNPFTFELFLCWGSLHLAKTRSNVPTSKLCRNSSITFENMY